METSPPAVGFPAAWKLRLPKVARAQAIRATAMHWATMAIGAEERSEPLIRSPSIASTMSTNAPSDKDAVLAYVRSGRLLRERVYGDTTGMDLIQAVRQGEMAGVETGDRRGGRVRAVGESVDPKIQYPV